MKFEKVTDNKIKISLSLAELQKKNIDYHSFMSNSPVVQNLFLSLLEEANLKLGFDTENCKVVIETLSISNETFIFTITKVSNCSHKKTVHARRKYPSNISELCIYSFSCINDFIDFSRSLPYQKNSEASLYLYNDTFYLIVNLLNFDSSFLKYFYYYISEFANFTNLSILSKLVEHGHCVIPSNALSSFYNS